MDEARPTGKSCQWIFRFPWSAAAIFLARTSCLTVVIRQPPEDLLVIEEMLKIETEPLEHSGLLALLDLPKVLGCREKSFLDYS